MGYVMFFNMLIQYLMVICTAQSRLGSRAGQVVFFEDGLRSAVADLGLVLCWQRHLVCQKIKWFLSVQTVRLRCATDMTNNGQITWLRRGVGRKVCQLKDVKWRI